MDTSLVVADFTSRLSRGIRAFSGWPDEAVRAEVTPLDDAKDIREFAKPLLGKKGASLGITHARYEKRDGDRHTVVEYKFDEAELNRAALNIDRALGVGQIELEEQAPSPKETMLREVMLFMDQANRGPGKAKGRTGDRGIIPTVSDKALPVYFRKGFRDLKGQITKEVNPLTSTFVVDAYAQYVNGEPRGYIVLEIHQVIEVDDAS